ncbi:PH domain-containing protein [Patescibacteria group bacterium]
MHVDELIHRKPDETVVFFLRRHWIILLGAELMIAFMMLIPIGAWIVMSLYWPELLAGPLTGPVVRLLISAYCLFVWLFGFANFVDFYLDAWIVTNDRILNVEQDGLFDRTVSELDLAKVQDVTSEVKGVLPFAFGYGTVYVQTAGEKERFIFEQVPKPEEVRKRLLILVDEDRRRQGAAMFEAQSGL